jgi:hypothetical protein
VVLGCGFNNEITDFYGLTLIGWSFFALFRAKVFWFGGFKDTHKLKRTQIKIKKRTLNEVG